MNKRFSGAFLLVEYMALYPEVQEKCSREIEDVLGSAGTKANNAALQSNQFINHLITLFTILKKNN